MIGINYLTQTQLICFKNSYNAIMNIFRVTQDFICFECGSVLSSDSELNNHIMKYHFSIKDFKVIGPMYQVLLFHKMLPVSKLEF